MEYSINALAKLAGVTPRTLRWYDETGLLKPLRTTSAGYRVYGPQQVERLQDILFYRELGFELSDIGTILDDPAFDRQAALQNHLTTLEQQRNRLDALILTVQKTISTLQGETTMTDTEKFEAFKRKAVEENETKYGKEAREKYGDEAVNQSNANILSLSPESYQRWQTLDAEILSALSAAVKNGVAADSEEGLRIAALHKEWLSFSWKTYTPQAHAGLAMMYTSDERFTAYYDQATPGCAVFLQNAILAYTQN